MEQLTVFNSSVVVLLCAFFFQSSSAQVHAASASVTSPSVYSYEIIATYPHDPASFTQGLAYDNGLLYEGTGNYGHSRLISKLLDGSSVNVRSLAPHLFGEGITVFGDDIVQLTWKSRMGIVWDKKSFQVKRIFHYPTEGWGITHNDQSLILSDGTSTLYFLDPSTFSIHHTIDVSSQQAAVSKLNEIEYIKGEIWANIWQDNRIVRIDPETGKVNSWIDLSELVQSSAPAGIDYVLNGIAYDKENDRIFITGKCWDTLFQIKIIE